MTTNSRVPAVIDALVTVLDTALDIKVYDGPVATSDQPADSVVVGYDGGTQSEYLAAESEQTWRGIGAKHRDETIPVHCAVVSVRNDETWKAARDAVYGLMEDIDTAIHSDPSLGLSSPCVALITSQQFYQIPSAGKAAKITFVVTVKTRI